MKVSAYHKAAKIPLGFVWLLGLALVLLSACGARLPDVPLQDGDLIFQTSRSSQSQAIQHATGSTFSHMGVIFIRDGHPQVLEAVKTVRYTALDRWISRGEGGHYVIRRMNNAATVLTPEKIGRLQSVAQSFIGKHYDLGFGWSDDRLYCSELAWKLYDRALGVQIGHLQKMRDFKLDDPVVKAKVLERYGKNVPLDEPVIAPEAIFRDPTLVTVAEK